MAAADALREIRNAPYRFHFPLFTTSTGQILSGDAANLTASVSLASGAIAGIAGTETEIGSTGIYYVDMTAAEMTASGAIFVHVVSSTGTAKEVLEELKPEPCLDSGVAQASTSATIVLRSAASATDNLYNGAMVEIVRGTGAGQVRTIVDYVGSSKTCTVDRAWATTPSTDSVYVIHPRTGTIPAGIFGSVSDASATTTDFDGNSALSSSDNFYNNACLMFVSGALAGLARPINDYTGSSRNFTFTSAFAWPSAPANGDEFVIIGIFA